MNKSYNKEIIVNIYTNIIKTSRNKNFYLENAVDDTVEGRFDIITLHSFVVFNFFIDAGYKKSTFPQQLFDHMFNDFDSNLREMGFGDIAVNKRMKQFIKAFYGRIKNYSNGIKDIKDNNDSTLFRATILKNIYKDNSKSSKNIDFWENYITRNISNFKVNTLEQNIENSFNFI